MGPGRRSSFYRDQGNLLRSAQSKAYQDPNMLLGATGPSQGVTWGDFANQDPFMETYYGKKKAQAGLGGGDPSLR
jgi:hypothetical protein